MPRLSYQEALKNAAKTMVRVKSPNRLLKMIIRFVEGEMKLTHASILIYDAARNRFIFADSKGRERIPPSLVRLDGDNPLVQWFMSRQKNRRFRRDFLSHDELSGWLLDQQTLATSPDLEHRLKAVRRTMEILRATVCVPGFYKGELIGILVLGRKLDGKGFSATELSFLQTLTNDASLTIKAAQYRDDLTRKNKELEDKVREVNSLLTKRQELYYQIILSLAQEIHARDAYTYGHTKAVETLGLMTAEAMGIDLKERKKDTLIASLHLHDLGKVGIPDRILQKPGPLTEEEWKVMREHTFKGAKILEPLDDFKEVARIILLHHEKYDGSGYPFGLAGEEIPIEARIIAVVDAYHAMVSNRCYRPARPEEQALQELERCAGTQFDPTVVHAFVDVIRSN